ncbi:hypothetical protein BXZ70DRAFT_68515 [Cristinia sonorae]|uniref:Uncharacterized protein n=1 Tax=Cristinia sonorae TaxID=1940300 RepID=A0A8K0UTP5_9AGAR|nr:hypothetical protein BXZ70DRAFT_68515 [Cristinia sonorae]
MTSTYTESRLAGRRNAVPLLLSSFPAPPTHIPASPAVSSPFTPGSLPGSSFPSHLGPPPSLPPSAPLPPVPGPSPISEQDTLMFISAARSRRASKLSLASSASSYSHRDSIATISSVSNGAPPLSPTFGTWQSFPSSSSLSPSPRRLLNPPSQISEEDSTRMTLEELTLSRSPEPPRPGEASEDEFSQLSHAEVATARKVRMTHRSRTDPLNDSISSIELKDLPPDDEDDEAPATKAPVLSRSTLQPPTKLVRALSRSKLNKELPPLPPSRVSIVSAPGGRSVSPDIQSIIASTPKPRRKSASALVSRSVSRSQSKSRPAVKRRVSEGQSGPFTVTVDSFDLRDHSRERTHDEKSELPYVRRHEEEILDDDASFVSDYGEYINGGGMASEILDRDAEMRLERQLEGDGSDSDSSIDVHTPLPHLMLRDGLLSPHSKLLPQPDKAETPQQPTFDRMSLASTSGSVMTKTGLFKDSRDTQRRRTRHRDGKLLRGGIGLTTGLGWSDSEDEDAPSPLTRRLSSLILSRKASSNSLQSSTLSRSVSDTLTSASAALDHHQRSVKSKRSLPPTAWQRNNGLRSSASSTSTMQSATFGGNSARSSNATDYSSLAPSRRTSESHPAHEEGSRVSSASTSSASSVAMPITPADEDPTWAKDGRSKTPVKSAMRKIPSTASLRGGASSGVPTRSRTLSTSSNSSVVAAVGTNGSSNLRKPSSMPPPRAPIPRPLRLPNSANTLHTSSLSTPSLSSSSISPRSSAGSSPSSSVARDGARARAVSGASSIPSAPRQTRSGMATAPASPAVPLGERPKPRTGTGMVYRTGSASTVSRQPSVTTRPPTTPLLRATANGVRT